MQAPTVEVHGGIIVVRDDLYPGGTKARFIPKLFGNYEEVVYASPTCGGAQYALALVGQQLAKRVTIFTSKRKELHPRSRMAQLAGAKIEQCLPGYMAVLQKRAREYVAMEGWKRLLLPFGLDVPEAAAVIAEAAVMARIKSPDQVWCAAGSGVLARGLMLAWPDAEFNVVQVGHALEEKDVPGAIIWKFPIPFEKEARMFDGFPLPFSSDLHYDAKAWQMCQQHSGNRGTIVFWNVLGEAR
jgi:hypothetical protein